MNTVVTLIPGDGIGPDITDATLLVLEAADARIDWDPQLAGIAAVNEFHTPLPDGTLASIRKNRVALKGPLTTPVGVGFRSINVTLRKEFDLYANVRPAKSVLPNGKFDNVDVVLVRENTEGLYIGIEHYVKVGDDPRAVAQSSAVITRFGAERAVRYAFEYALKNGRKNVTCDSSSAPALCPREAKASSAAARANSTKPVPGMSASAPSIWCSESSQCVATEKSVK